MEMQMGEGTLRQQAGPLALVRTAIGGPKQIADKLARVVRTARLFASPTEVDRRMRTLQARGYIDELPSKRQLLFGGLDMLRFVIAPAARDYYQAKGIDFTFHQLLRGLDDPVSIIDPTGFLSERDTIIGHLMQVVHLNPIYDLQLLEMFDDGLDQLERQVEQMIAGSHPRAGTISAIIEDPTYHGRLLDYVRAFRADRKAAPPVRQEQTLRDDPVFVAAEKTFATLPGFVAYCNKLPDDTATLARRLRRVKAFPVELAVAPE